MMHLMFEQQNSAAVLQFLHLCNFDSNIAMHSYHCNVLLLDSIDLSDYVINHDACAHPVRVF